MPYKHHLFFSRSWVCSPFRSNQRLWTWYLLLLH